MSVRGLSKAYTIAHNAARHTTAGEALMHRLKHPLHKAEKETFWALRDIDFDIKKGDVVGIIGRNGAGKSTLLKILSRITEPTTGQIDLYGRVGSLLEVGTGFHPELTGRENVFLNGAILGMSKRDIARQFGAIVEFSGTEQFLDTPVKRYSSGMYVRLAFAVAAHLNPEILIVDEVLAVGDAEFQKKCLGKMKDVSEQEGKTVLFVSHNITAITRLCSRAILLSGGRLALQGTAHEVAGAYVRGGENSGALKEWARTATAPGNEVARLRSVRVCTESGESTEVADIRAPVGVEMVYEVLESGHILVPNYHVFNEEGTNIFISQELEPEWRQRPRPAGIYQSTMWIPGNYLAEGTIFISVALSTFTPMTVHFHERDIIAFQVVDNMLGDTARGDFHGYLPGAVRPLLRWTTRSLVSDDLVSSDVVSAV